MGQTSQGEKGLINALTIQDKRKLAKSSKWGKSICEQGSVLNQNKPDKLQ